MKGTNSISLVHILKQCKTLLGKGCSRKQEAVQASLGLDNMQLLRISDMGHNG